MNRFHLVFSSLILLVYGAGCSGLRYTPAPTPFPPDYIPTIIALTVQAGQPASSTPLMALTDTSLPPTSTLTPQASNPTGQASPTPIVNAATHTVATNPGLTVTLEQGLTPTSRPTRTPTLTPTPPIPNAGVQISEPGPMSRVASPLQLIANLHTISSGSYHVEIWTEPLVPGGDPRLLYRDVQNLISDPMPWMYLDEQIKFELSRVSEFAQLRLSVFDQYGRPVSVGSVDLILLSMGLSEITPTGPLTEPIIIHEPTSNQLIQGGSVIVSGLANPTEQFMLVELVTFDGTVVGYRQAFATPAPDGSYVPYAVEVPYQVTTPTWVRLRVSESGTRISGYEHLSSLEVLLSP